MGQSSSHHWLITLASIACHWSVMSCLQHLSMVNLIPSTSNQPCPHLSVSVISKKAHQLLVNYVHLYSELVIAQSCTYQSLLLRYSSIIFRHWSINTHLLISQWSVIQSTSYQYCSVMFTPSHQSVMYISTTCQSYPHLQQISVW